MHYTGFLRIDETATPGLAVKIGIVDDAVVIQDDSDVVLGKWDPEDVTFDRFMGDLFKVTFGDESFIFEAANRLAFAYDAPRELAELELKLNQGLRGVRRRRRRASQDDQPVTPVGPRPASSPTPPVSTTSEPPLPPRRRAVTPAPGSTAGTLAHGYEPAVAEDDHPGGDPFDAPSHEVTQDETAIVLDITDRAVARAGVVNRIRSKVNHVHTFEENVISGGIVRRVCSECHHVSIGAS